MRIRVIRVLVYEGLEDDIRAQMLHNYIQPHTTNLYLPFRIYEDSCDVITDKGPVPYEVWEKEN